MHFNNCIFSLLNFGSFLSVSIPYTKVKMSQEKRNIVVSILNASAGRKSFKELNGGNPSGNILTD